MGTLKPLVNGSPMKVIAEDEPEDEENRKRSVSGSSENMTSLDKIESVNPQVKGLSERVTEQQETEDMENLMPLMDGAPEEVKEEPSEIQEVLDNIPVDCLKSSEKEIQLQPLLDGSSDKTMMESIKKMDSSEPLGESMVDMESSADYKRKKGSALKQVVAALFGNIGSINTGMMFGFSAVTIPQLMEPDSFIQITNDEASWIASLSSVTTPFGCIFSGYLLDSIGRKPTIILTMMPMMVGWFLVGTATNVYTIYAGRLFVGLGSGMMESPARVYTGEVTQPHLRGMLAAGASVGMSFGVTLQYVLGAILPWYWLASFNATIPTVGLLAAFFLPESPTWLLIKGRTEDARSSLHRLRGPTCDLETELNDLVDYSRKLSITLNPSMTTTLRSMMRPHALKPFIILAVFFVIYQFSGISPITFYAVQVFKESGASMNPHVATIVLGLVRLFFTIVSFVLLRRCGRRPLTFVSTVLCCLSMYGLGFYIYLVQEWRAEGSEPVATWFPAFIIFFFMSACTIGLAVLPWAMIGELYPAKVRGIMGGMTTCVGHVCVFVVIKTFPLMLSYSKYGPFVMFGTVSLVGTIYLYIYLPETKGRTLQEIEDFFRGRTKTLKPRKNAASKNDKPNRRAKTI